MKVTLSPSFELTDEHAATSYERPMLVRRSTGEAFGPGDLLQPHATWPVLSATEAVRRMARTRTKKLTYDEQAFVDKFVNFGK